MVGVKKKAVALAAAVAALGLLISGCGSSDDGASAGGGSIKIGLLASLSGLRPSEGKLEVAAAQTAVDEINAAGGVNGSKLKLVTQDDAFDAATSATAAERLIQQGVVALTGVAGSDMQKAVTEVADRRKVPLMGSVSIATGLTDGKPFAFRSAGENDYIGKLIVAFAKSHGAKKVAIIADQTSFGQDLGAAYKTEAEAAGLDIVTTQSYASGATDLTPQALSVKRSGADSVLLAPAVGADAALFARDLVENNVLVPVFGHSGLTLPDAISNGATYFSKLPAVYASTPVDLSRPDVQAVATKIKAASGIDVTDEHPIQTYDAVQILAKALAADDGKGGEDLAKAIEGIQNYKGLSGKEGSYYSFSADQHTGLAGDYLVFNKWDGSKYEQVK